MNTEDRPVEGRTRTAGETLIARTRTRRFRTAAAVATGLLAATQLAGCSGSSSSDSSGQATAGSYSNVEDCTGAGQVWLVVSTDEGRVLANQCVGTPGNGTAALDAAGLAIGRDSKSQFICQIGDYPSECPTTYEKYWNYYHAKPGGTWFYSQEGADTYKPEAGSIEGWCFGSACTPEGIEGSAAPQASSSSSGSSSSTGAESSGEPSSAASSAG